jgi:aminoglycoside phosphotransferase (APT) family kinase protein
VYVRYKPGTSCIVGFRVRAAGNEFDVYARAHDGAGAVKLRAKRDPIPGPLGPRGIRIDRDLRVVVFVSPNDHEIGGLRLLGRPETRRRLLARILPDPPRDAGLTRLRYKPERRFVARLDDPRAAIKCYAEEEFDDAAANSRAFVPSGPLVVPRRLGTSARRATIAWEWIDGRCLSDAILAAEADACTLRGVGAALARLHAQAPRLPVRYTRDDLARLARDAAQTIATLAPHLGTLAAHIADECCTGFARGTPPRPLHGDFSPEQAILTPDGRIGIVDFDRAGLGDPLYDLGTFAARLECTALCHRPEGFDADSVLDAVAAGYADERGMIGDIAPYAAASLLLLAAEPFRRRHPDWAGLTAAVLHKAHGYLRRAPATA